MYVERDGESPKYELNVTDYDEGWLGALRVGLNRLTPECLKISQIYACLIFLDTHEYVFYISLKSRVGCEARVVFQCPLIEEFQGSKMSSI